MGYNAAMANDDNHYLTVIKVWAALVWADGVVSTPEAHAMRRLIASAELGDAERELAHGFLESEVKLETAGLAELDEPSREGIYRAAVKLSAIDDDITDSEIDFLTRLRRGLAISDETAERIEDTVAAGG
jgi:uncharacterized membrane protein YebE (DUF533 family)